MFSVQQISVVMGLSSMIATLSLHYLIFKLFFELDEIDDDFWTFMAYLLTTFVMTYLIFSYWLQKLVIMKISFYGSILIVILWFIALILYLHNGNHCLPKRLKESKEGISYAIHSFSMTTIGKLARAFSWSKLSWTSFTPRLFNIY